MPKRADENPKKQPGKSRRHPAFGWMKGTITIAPGVDLTEPAWPEWADLVEEKCERLARALSENRKGRT